MPHYLLNNAQYHVVECGNGYPLLLLHGFTGSSADWSLISQALSPNYRCICPDLLGHGQTDIPGDWRRYSMENATADMLSLLDRLSVSSAVVIGYSMGGRLALHLACQAPEHVRALVLEGASPGLATVEARIERAQSDDALAEYIVDAGVMAFVQRWENLPLFASQHNLSDAQKSALRQSRLRNSPTGLANSLRGMSTGRQPSLWEELLTLQMPVCLLVGEKDAKFHAIAKKMHEQLPNSSVYLVPDAGHNAHLEQPEAFLTAIRDFLQTTRLI